MLANTVTFNVDPQTVLTWAFVGLVAGFLASKVMLGHGLGVLGDIVVGIVGALAGGYLAGYMGITLNVPNHPIISQIILGFLGAVILLGLFRLVNVRKRRHSALAR